MDDQGNWIGLGRDVTAKIIDRVLPGKSSAMHLLGNVKIEVDGDVAFTESYVMAFRTAERESRAYTRTRAVRSWTSSSAGRVSGESLSAS